MDKPTPVITVKNLSVEFPAMDGMVSVVNNISFNINENEIIGLVGESGSGKSVTALSMMQLIRFIPGHRQSGEILLHSDGVSFDLMRYRDRQLEDVRGRHISMVFQEPMSSLNPAIKVGEQIAETMRRHLGLSRIQAKAQTIQLIHQVGLHNGLMIYEKYPNQLSGGQKQRILIAAAIASKPRLLIADEPTTALDVSVQKRIIDLLVKIQRERRMSVLFISHDLDLLGSFADRIHVMYAGKIVESGPTEEIFNNPKHPYTKGLIACRAPRKKRYIFLPTIQDFMRISADGQRLEETADIPSIQADLEISDFSRNSRLTKIYSTKPVLKADGLCKTYQTSRSQVTALKDVCLDLFEGETLGIVGESGCGKTTLAKGLVDLISLDRGKVSFRSDPEGNATRLQRARHVQYIFQDPFSSLNPRLTIGQQLMEPLKIHKIGSNEAEWKQRVNDMLIQVGLRQFHFSKYPNEFSGGQRQRICIARALLLEPEILICDESVSALDVSVQAQVLNLLNELKYQFNLSYLFISHDLSVVRFMSDRILVMKNGEVVEAGDADEIYFNPQEDYTKELIRSIPVSKSMAT